MRLGGVYNNNFHVFQTEDYVAILLEMVHEMRIIPLDGSGPTDSTPSQWLGRSRGHWEGDTLVVETTNFHGETSFRTTRAAVGCIGSSVSENDLAAGFVIWDIVWT